MRKNSKTCINCGAGGRFCPMSADGEGPHVYAEPATDWVAQAEARQAAAAEQQLRERDARILAYDGPLDIQGAAERRAAERRSNIRNEVAS